MASDNKNPILEFLNSKLRELEARNRSYHSYDDPKSELCKECIEALNVAIRSLHDKPDLWESSFCPGIVNTSYWALVREFGGDLSATLYLTKEQAIEASHAFNDGHEDLKGEVDWCVTSVDCPTLDMRYRIEVPEGIVYLFIKGDFGDYSVELYTSAAEAEHALDQHASEFPDYYDPDRGLIGNHVAWLPRP